MNFKRSVFVGVLMLLFLCCYHIMNQHVDELSRYQYTTEENRKIILEYLNTDEINYLIDRQYEPDEFMRYLGIDGFNIRYVDWYNYAKSIENMKNSEIISIVNQLYEKMNFSAFKKYTEHYTITQLKEFYIDDNPFINDLTLIEDPTSVRGEIEAGKTLFTYVPLNLVEIKDLPIANQIEKKESIYLQEDASEALKSMCKASFEINEKVCGDMIITQGYVSSDLQETLYQQGLLDYGVEEIFNYVDYPGTSIYQLGNVVKLVPVGISNKVNEETEEEVDEETTEEITLQQAWLMEHAKEYGFEFVNDTNEKLSEFVLQYVGIDENISIEGEE